MPQETKVSSSFTGPFNSDANERVTRYWSKSCDSSRAMFAPYFLPISYFLHINSLDLGHTRAGHRPLAFDSKLLQILIICHVCINRLANDLGPFFSEFFNPFSIFVLYTRHLLFLTGAYVSVRSKSRSDEEHPGLLTWRRGLRSLLLMTSS